jgi:hypothetical protein
MKKKNTLGALWVLPISRQMRACFHHDLKPPGARPIFIAKGHTDAIDTRQFARHRTVYPAPF